MRRRGDLPSRVSIDSVRGYFLCFGKIDCGEGGRVNNQGRMSGKDGRPRRSGLCEVELRPPDQQHTIAAALGKALRKLAVATGHEYRHRAFDVAVCPSRAPLYLPSRIGRHHASLAKNQSIVSASPASNV